MGNLKYLVTGIAFILSSVMFGQELWIDGQSAPKTYGSELANVNKAVNSRILEKASSQRGQSGRYFADDEVWTIPVVVHVIHKGGPIDFDLVENTEDEALRLGNVSRYQITGALDALSERFRARVANPIRNDNDLSIYAQGSVTEFDDNPFSTDMGIQFQLATIDPDGNPTDGIVRHDMSGSLAFDLYGTISNLSPIGEDTTGAIQQSVIDASTSEGYNVTFGQMMEEWGWPSHEYINIYLTPEIDDNDGSCVNAGVRSGAPMSPVVDDSENFGFLWVTRLFTSGRFGSLYGGSGSDVSRFVKNTAGMFGLLPVWTGYPSCASLQVEQDSLYGDGVADTPPNVQGCGCSFRCGDPVDFGYANGVPDYRNYMDGSCGSQFTPGQVDRLRAFTEEFWPNFAVSNNPKLAPVAYADLAVETTAERVGYNLYYPTVIVKNLGNTKVSEWSVTTTVPGTSISVTYDDTDFGAIPAGEQFNIKLPVFQLTEFKEYEIESTLNSPLDSYSGNNKQSHVFTKEFDAPVTVSSSYFASGTFSEEPYLGIVPAEGNELYGAYIGNGLQQVFNRPIEESPFGTQNFLKDPRKGNQGSFSWYNTYWNGNQFGADPLDPRASWALNAEELRSDFSLVDYNDSLILEDTYYVTEGDWNIYLKGIARCVNCFDFWNGIENEGNEPTHSSLADNFFNCYDKDKLPLLFDDGILDSWCNVGLQFNGSYLFYEDQDDILARLHPMCTGAGLVEYNAQKDSITGLLNDVRNNTENPLYSDANEIQRLVNELRERASTWMAFCGLQSGQQYFDVAKTIYDPNISASSVETLEDGSLKINPWLKYSVTVSQDNPYQAPSCLDGGATGDGVCPNLGATNYNTDLSLGYVYQRNERQLHVTAQINNPGYFSIDSMRFELSTDPAFDPALTEAITLRSNHIGNRNMGLLAADQKHLTALPITVAVFEDLAPSTTYYYRVIAGNETIGDQFTSIGFSCDGIGESITFAGVTYDVVSIGDQCWFARDLATDQFANGDPIQSGSSTDHPSDWADEWIETMDADPTTPLQVTPRPRFNGDDVSDRGSLYNYAAVQDERGICPIGWRVPSQADVNELYDEVRQIYGTNDPTVLKHVLYDFDHDDAISQYTNNLGFKFRAANHPSFKSFESLPNRTWMTDGTSPWAGNEAWLQAKVDSLYPGENYLIDAHALGRYEKQVAYNSQFYIPGFTEEVATEISEVGLSNSIYLQYNATGELNPGSSGFGQDIGRSGVSVYGIEPSKRRSDFGGCNPPFPPLTYDDAVAQGCGDCMGRMCSFMGTGSFFSSFNNLTYWRIMGLHPDVLDEFGNPAPDTSYTNVSTDPHYIFNEKYFRLGHNEYAGYPIREGHNFTDAMWISDAYKDHRKELWLFHPGEVADEATPIEQIGVASGVYWDSLYSHYRRPVSQSDWIGGGIGQNWFDRQIIEGSDVLGGIFNERVLRPLDYADDFTYGELQRIGRVQKRLFVYDGWEWSGYPKELTYNPDYYYDPSYVQYEGLPGPSSYDFKYVKYNDRGVSGDRFGWRTNNQTPINRDDINMFNVPEGQNYMPYSNNVNATETDSTDWATYWRNSSFGGSVANTWGQASKLSNGVDGHYLSNDEQAIAESAFMGLRTRCVTGGTTVPDINLEQGTLHSRKCTFADTLEWGYNSVTLNFGQPNEIKVQGGSSHLPFGNQFTYAEGTEIIQTNIGPRILLGKSTRDVILEDLGYAGGGYSNIASDQTQYVQCLSWNTPCNFNLALQEEPVDSDGFELDILRDDDVFIADACGDCAELSEFFTNIDEGYCDCEGNVVDALGVCGGDCAADVDNNGICDFIEASYADACEGLTALNYNFNDYELISIGRQCWFAENLKEVTLTNGTNIPEVQSPEVWAALETPARVAYDVGDFTQSDFEENGWLYNWYAVETGKLCPSGWHVPSDDDWKELESLLGMTDNELVRMDLRGTNELIGSQMKVGGLSRLDLRPSGLRVGYDGAFKEAGNGGYYWSSTESNDRRPSRRETAIHRGVTNQTSGVLRYSDSWSTANTKKHGLSVRCLKDRDLE